MEEWDDWWDEMMPDDDCKTTKVCNAIGDAAIFFAKVVGSLLFIAVVIALFAYDIWREIAIFNFLTGQ